MQKNTSVYRYEFTLDSKKIQMPAGAVVLEAIPSLKEPKVHLYAMVDTTAPLEDRYFVFVKTGEPMPEKMWDARHLLSLMGGHLFEVSAELAFQF